MATANTNATVAYSKRRARHGRSPFSIRRATWDFSAQNVAKSGVANVLTLPAGTYVLGGKLTVSTALTSSATMTVALGSTALTAAVAASTGTTVLGVAATADMAAYTASAASLTITNGSAAAAVAGVVELEAICFEKDKL